MDFFEYEPIDLGGPAFRLLRLIRGKELDIKGEELDIKCELDIEGEELDIECELFQAWLYDDSAIRYEALSYTWGGTEMTKYIKINGRGLSVTENLFWALGHLRSRDADRILWVDAVCIN
ncbi:hypothetical protein V2W45_1495260 [Cenococcum geophilum]